MIVSVALELHDAAQVRGPVHKVDLAPRDVLHLATVNVLAPGRVETPVS